MRSLLACSLVALITGCATSKQIVGPNGVAAHSIRCGAAVADACYEKAGEVCPNGYTVLNSQGSRYLGQIGTASVSGSYGSATSTPLITPNTLLVECKPAK
jgi:hypothetical protein